MALDYRLNPEVEKFLREQQERQARQTNPDYQASLGRERLADQGAAREQQQIASYAKGLAQVGSLGGKVADTRAVDDTASQINQSQAQMIEQRQADQDDLDRRTGLKMKTMDYLQARADKQAEAEREDERDDLKRKADVKLAETKHKNDIELEGLKSSNAVKLAQSKPHSQDRLNASPIYGAKPLAGITPTRQDAEKVKAARDARDGVISGLVRLDDLYRKHGTESYGDASSDMESIVTGMQLSLKELQNLGVLNGPDLMLLQNQIPDPSSFKENLKGFVGQDRYSSKRNSFAKSLEDKFDFGLRARGYERSDSRLGDYNPKSSGTALAAPAAPTTPGPQPGEVKVTSPSGEVGYVSEDELEDAIAEGYEVIK